MQQFELDRAFEVFARELKDTRDPKQALRAAIVDFESRLLPQERQRAATEAITRPLFQRHRALIEAVCLATRANLGLVCSYGRSGSAEVDARGVLVGILSDSGLSARQIAEGIGMSNSVVNNCRSMRTSRPDWEPLIATYASLLRKPNH